jgi:hypothetical protein
MIHLPSSGPWDEKDLIGNPPLPMFVEVVGPAGSLADQLFLPRNFGSALR